MAGSAKSIQTNRGGMADAELRGIFAKTHSAKKFQKRFFCPSVFGSNPEEENRPLKKLNYQIGLVRLADNFSSSSVYQSRA